MIAATASALHGVLVSALREVSGTPPRLASLERLGRDLTPGVALCLLDVSPLGRAGSIPVPRPGERIEAPRPAVSLRFLLLSADGDALRAMEALDLCLSAFAASPVLAMPGQAAPSHVTQEVVDAAGRTALAAGLGFLPSHFALLAVQPVPLGATPAKSVIPVPTHPADREPR